MINLMDGKCCIHVSGGRVNFEKNKIVLIFSEKNKMLLNKNDCSRREKNKNKLSQSVKK